MVGYASPKVDVPSNLTELILTGNGALVRIQQRAEREWVAVIHRDGDFDRAVRADTRDELLRIVGAEEATK
jgi:hypothetical protein